MKRIAIPYGKGEMIAKLPEDAFVLTSRVDELHPDRPEDEIVKAAMAAPIGTKPLWQLAQGKKTATLIISDHTRPVPSRHIVPFMLAELRRGNPDIDITLLVATGCHRDTTPAELEAKLGKDIAANEKIAVHDCMDAAGNVKIGVLPSGADLIIDRAAVETDLLVAEGFIEPHFFAGYSGGRKSVLPGVCDRVTVHGNHCAAFIESPFARTGILQGNPIHKDMVAAAEMANLAYIVNVVINEEKQVVAAFAGHREQAHEAGCQWLAQYCGAARQEADIVITSNGGAPLDQNIYQCVKGMTAAEATAAPGAVIILCAECADGHGGERFYRDMRDCQSPAQLLSDILKVSQKDTVADQWQYQILARVLKKHQVIFVTRPELKDMIEEMKMTYAPTAQQALEMAYAKKGPNARVCAIPNGVSIVIK
ncbi:MAG: nickel-dependent lactate racemase [Christensenellaceae bacterium]|nr:nickel-dependent lactate racemase [Christensenellaceae bacterium]